VHIQAHNSLLFYASTLVSPTLSMLLLMQQMFRRRHSQLPIKIGQQIAWHHWHSATLSSREMAEQCRQHVMRLGKGVPGVFKTQCAIARPEDRATLKRALAQAECLGNTSDGKTIYLWQRNGQEDAPLLRELGRLREIAFRAVEEGSGKRRDTDSYDDDYLHLILWDEDDLEIVGAYRFMPTAMQIEKRGVEGLYSYSLFHYDDKMQDVLEHGIELGRSFIQPRYWGRRGLDYLWSGIGAYLARYPHYRYLFGPVSISGGLPPAAGSAGGLLPPVVPGDASAGRVASAVSRIPAGRAGAVWRRGLRGRSDEAEIPARQSWLRHSAALQAIFRAVRARRRAVY
jgi:putative hemolysin